MPPPPFQCIPGVPEVDSGVCAADICSGKQIGFGQQAPPTAALGGWLRMLSEAGRCICVVFEVDGQVAGLSSAVHLRPPPPAPTLTTGRPHPHRAGKAAMPARPSNACWSASREALSLEDPPRRFHRPHGTACGGDLAAAVKVKALGSGWGPGLGEANQPTKSASRIWGPAVSRTDGGMGWDGGLSNTSLPYGRVCRSRAILLDALLCSCWPCIYPPVALLASKPATGRGRVSVAGCFSIAERGTVGCCLFDVVICMWRHGLCHDFVLHSLGGTQQLLCVFVWS